MNKYGANWVLVLFIVVMSAIISGCDILYPPEEMGPPSTSFRPDHPSLITTLDVTTITMTSAVSGGIISWGGRAPITTRGVCWSTTGNPTTDSSKTSDGSGTGSFTSSLIGLAANTKYYVRAYASNSYGTGYGVAQQFRSYPEVPLVSTTPVYYYTNSSAKVEGKVTSQGLTAVTERGIFWGTRPDPEIYGTKSKIGSGTGSFSTDLMGLNPLTKYYVKAYAVNTIGTSYGELYSFTTNQEYSLPYFSTSPITKTTLNSADGGGNIDYDGGSAISVRGVCWSTKQNPTISDNRTQDFTGMGSYSSKLAGLTANTTYYVRAYAVNELGVAYGDQIVFTSRTGTIYDVEGNMYYTQTIGNQIWMAENLRTKKFNNNDDIPLVTSNTAWSELTTPGCCFYNNSESTYKNSLGALYNWYAVNNNNLCPSGWHVPDNDEWFTLISFLGGEYLAGLKLKEAGTDHWIGINIGTNESGFTALPGGFRGTLQGHFFLQNIMYSLGDGNTHNDRESLLWSSEMYSSTFGNMMIIGNKTNKAFLRPFPKGSGLGVRCIKNE